MDKQLLFLLVLIPVAIIGSDFFLFSKERSNEIARLSNAIQDKSNQTIDANTAKTTLPKMEASMTKLTSQYDEVIRAIPTPEEAENLIKQSITIADKWIKFTELSQMTKKKNKMPVKTSIGDTSVDYDEISMKMTSKASFAKLGRYFQEIENLQVQNVRKLVDVVGLDVAVGPDSEQLLVTMEMKTYTFPVK